ncbi:MAG: MarR family winged helix-turn-helix transcriptional regulator [Alphaproteobacteria bacterium]
MFFLKELPSEKIMQRYARRFPEMDIDKTREALHMMRNASLLMRDLENYFRKYHFSMTRFLILIVLDREHELETFTISDLVSRLDISKPVITTTAKRLEQDKMIQFDKNESDARYKKIRITKKGRDTISKIMPGYYKIINEHM